MKRATKKIQAGAGRPQKGGGSGEVLKGLAGPWSGSGSGSGRDALLRAILETAVEGIIVIDERGRIELANPAAERIFGYDSSEMIGRNVSMLMPSPDREQHDRYIGRYLETGQARVIGIGREVQGRRKDGMLFPMDLSISEVNAGGRRVFTGFVRDISDRRRMEQEISQVVESEQRRIGQDLHDGVCQYLAGVGLTVQALDRGPGSRVTLERAKLAQIAAGLREVTEQARRIARGLCPVVLESEGLEVALRELASGTTALFGIRTEFRPLTPIQIDDHTITTHLYRIAQEAVNNAVKHSGATRIEIQLRSDPLRLVLAVRDDGRGIGEELRRSSGMGLRIIQYRAGIIGGTLGVQRHPEGGTEVVCTVRRSDPDQRAGGDGK